MSNIVTLQEHVNQVKTKKRVFENAFQAVSRMIIEHNVSSVTHAGSTINDFPFFRAEGKHLIGMYEEINTFVNFVKDAAEGGSSKEMAYILVGEPGNGKTFFNEYLSERYREFLSIDKNRKYTFQFINLQELGNFGAIQKIQSQTYEDPMILAMNLEFDKAKSQERLAKFFKIKDDALVREFYKNHRPLGACSGYIWSLIYEKCEGDFAKMMEFVQIIPVPLIESVGTVTGKYPAKDKITSSSVDLLGEESIQRLLHITDTDNPYRFDLRRGALARVAGGGIHFADEIYKNKKDLLQVYLGVIQNRVIEIDGFKWPIDTLIVATSNNDEFNNYKSEGSEAPIIDRCRVTYVSHNTNYKLQKDLTNYALGGAKTTITGEPMHRDPNLNYAASVAVVLTRLPRHEKLTPIEMMKLAAGEIAGEKSTKTLAEVIEELAQKDDITKRFGQTGLGQRNLGRAFQILLEKNETYKGKCMFALDIFATLERVTRDYVQDTALKDKFLKDIQLARGIYRERILEVMFNAYMDDPQAIKKDVFNYVNMIIGIDADNLGPDNMWKYKDPQSGERRVLKIDKKFINSVEDRLGLKTDEQKQTFRTSIRKIYGQKIINDPNYDFMDNLELVKAVSDVRLKSDIAGAGSLVGALANRTNEENLNLYNRVMDSMTTKLGYCKTCAQKTIEFFCTADK